MYKEEMPNALNLYSTMIGSNQFTAPKKFILTGLIKDRGPTRNPVVTRIFGPSVQLSTRL